MPAFRLDSRPTSQVEQEGIACLGSGHAFVEIAASRGLIDGPNIVGGVNTGRVAGQRTTQARTKIAFFRFGCDLADFRWRQCGEVAVGCSLDASVEIGLLLGRIGGWSEGTHH
jgi:hypothetical protein